MSASVKPGKNASHSPLHSGFTSYVSRSTQHAARSTQHFLRFTFLLIALLTLLATSVRASPSGALREYNSGKYDQALQEYERLLKRKPDDPRLHFNTGTAAYRSHRFDEAAKQFNDSLTSPDLKLQQQAYYNLGNTLYHLGEMNPDPSKKTETWQKSLQGYENTLKLNPGDSDARFNYEFVKKKLEELKQQQDKQKDQKDQNKSDDQKDQDQQKQQQENKDQKKDEDQKKDQQQNNPDKKQDSSQKDQQSQQQKQDEEEKQKQAAKQSQEQKDKEKDQQAKQSPSKEKPDEKDQGQPAQTYAAAQMTPEQAHQLLDAQKGDETVLPIKPTEKPKQANRSVKDW